jgi:hypothetical protein
MILAAYPLEIMGKKNQRILKKEVPTGQDFI